MGWDDNFARRTCRHVDENDVCSKVRDGVYTIEGQPGWEWHVKELELVYSYYHSSGDYLMSRGMEEGTDPVAFAALAEVLNTSEYSERHKDAIALSLIVDPNFHDSQKEIAKCLGVNYGTLRVLCNRTRQRIGLLMVDEGD
jgi:hypothetical protein